MLTKQQTIQVIQENSVWRVEKGFINMQVNAY